MEKSTYTHSEARQNDPTILDITMDNEDIGVVTRKIRQRPQNSQSGRVLEGSVWKSEFGDLVPVIVMVFQFRGTIFVN